MLQNGAIWTAGLVDSGIAMGIEVTCGSQPLAVLYAGPALGEINGLFQINVELPQGVTNPGLTVALPVIESLPAMSNTVQVYAQ